MITGAGHVTLASGDGSELIVELLQDGLICRLPGEDVLETQVPVVGVGKVTWVKDELIVVDGVGKPADGGVGERRVNGGDGIPLGRGEAVSSVDAQIDHDVHGKWRRVAGCAGTQEVVDGRVGRHNLVVVRGGRLQTGQGHRVGPCSRRGVRDRRGRASLRGQRAAGRAVLNARLAQLLVRVPANRHSWILVISNSHPRNNKDAPGYAQVGPLNARRCWTGVVSSEGMAGKLAEAAAYAARTGSPLARVKREAMPRM